MNGLPVGHYVVAGLCLVCATVLELTGTDSPLTMALFVTGAGVLGKVARDNQREAKEAKAEAEKNKQDYNDLLQEKQTLRRGK